MSLLKKMIPSFSGTNNEMPPEVHEAYRHWRFRIFLSIYLGYATFYFTRKSFTFAMPALMDDLGFSKSDLGFLASILYISYGISKFMSGVLSDRYNPRYFMSVGLIFTGVFNLLFGASSSLILFAIFWGLNGFFQGWGFPPCTKLMTHWFSKKERGSWWSLLSTSNNLGGALIPMLSVTVLTLFNWRWAMYGPGLISLLMGCFLLINLRGVPSTLGLPPIEEYMNDYEDDPSEKKLVSDSIKSSLLKVFKNRNVWILSLSCFLIYIIRSGLNDWIVVYLNKQKNIPLIEAAASAFWFEIGGFIGCFGAGWGSDILFHGKRIPYILICALALCSIFGVLWFFPLKSMLSFNLLIALCGFCIFGPQALIGLASAEFVSKDIACTSYGFTGGIAYLGAAASGYPLGKMIDTWGWNGFFSVLMISCVLLVVILLPLTSIKIFHGTTKPVPNKRLRPNMSLPR